MSPCGLVWKRQRFPGVLPTRGGRRASSCEGVTVSCAGNLLSLREAEERDSERWGLTWGHGRSDFL